MSSRTTRVTKRNPVSKRKKEKEGGSGGRKKKKKKKEKRKEKENRKKGRGKKGKEEPRKEFAVKEAGCSSGTHPLIRAPVLKMSKLYDPTVMSARGLGFPTLHCVPLQTLTISILTTILISNSPNAHYLPSL